MTIVFPPGAFRRVDETDDRRFYSFPRRVVHLDEGAMAALAGLYEHLLPTRGLCLDLMASWRSHVPTAFRGRLIGLGLNEAEMADNPQLGAAVVHDLNHEPRLPFRDEVFDAALCAVSIQYLTRPAEVFRAVRRTLKPGAPFVVSFSNRCFPEKAIALWHATTDEEHVTLVSAYFTASGDEGPGWVHVQDWANTPAEGDPLYAVWAVKA